MNGRDAIDLDLADRFLLDEQQPDLIEGLLQLNWQEQTDMQLNSLLKALQQEAVEQMPEAQWLPRREQIDDGHGLEPCAGQADHNPSSFNRRIGFSFGPDPVRHPSGQAQLPPVTSGDDDRFERGNNLPGPLSRWAVVISRADDD